MIPQMPPQLAWIDHITPEQLDTLERLFAPVGQRMYRTSIRPVTVGGPFVVYAFDDRGLIAAFLVRPDGVAIEVTHAFRSFRAESRLKQIVRRWLG